ncbi:MAG TPA: class I SAM-dependent methyltransferase [Methylomirabilota bacterium]|nr:class I SAM-dependent methyltransferase [Methylomirabilota bacterium]
MIVTWSKGPADEAMPQQMLVDTLGRVRRHPWWRARTELALAVLRREGINPPANVMDVGCGWGVNLDALEAAGYAASGLDISRQILEHIDRPARRLIEADLSRELPADPPLSDGLLSLDVIEHIDDDRGAVRRFARLVRHGGVAVVSVPARPDLFSEFDAIQGHRRRYLPEDFRAVFAGSGLQVRAILWWGAWMVPILRRTRHRQPAADGGSRRSYADYLKLPPWPGPWLMKWFYAWEKSRALKGQLETGTSLFAIAVREP